MEEPLKKGTGFGPYAESACPVEVSHVVYALHPNVVVCAYGVAHHPLDIVARYGVQGSQLRPEVLSHGMAPGSDA